ncbi:MAG: hypothetical protein KF819_13270 [Labilithrix sp.]|nr:hypothetical protein [Labilithrix sp.]
MSRNETQKKSSEPPGSRAFWRHPRAPLLLVFALGVVLFFPAIRAPLFLDDYLQGAMVEGTFPVARGPFDLYDFVDDASRTPLTERGLLPWWSHPKLTIRFFRPLSSALLWMDHRAFGHGALPMHLHSFAWWIAAVLAARTLFRDVFSPRVTALATAIFALSPCHSLPLAWVANREVLVSLAFGGVALAAQARWREDQRLRDGALAALMFALSMLGGGEYALSFAGYVVAMDLVRRESIGRRAVGLVPFALPAALYLITRGQLGYGSFGSGFYSDPLRDPAAFAADAPWRAVALLGMGWMTLDAEAWRLGASRWILVGLVATAALGMNVVLRRALSPLSPRARARATWLLVGSLIAIAPTLAVVPARRLLGVSMLGVALVVALVIDHVWFPTREEDKKPRDRAGILASLAALGLGFAHLVHGPGTSWLASRQHRMDGGEFADRVTWLRSKVPETSTSELGVVRGMAGAFFTPFALDRRGQTPARWWVLSQAGHVLVLRRGERTLEMIATPGRGLFPVGERNLYRSSSQPLRAGDELVVPGMRVTVLEVGEAGPRIARFDFDEDPERIFWVTDGFDDMKEAKLPRLGLGAPFDP